MRTSTLVLLEPSDRACKSLQYRQSAESDREREDVTLETPAERQGSSDVERN